MIHDLQKVPVNYICACIGGVFKRVCAPQDDSEFVLAISHRATQIAALRSALSQRKPKSQESCHAVSPNRTQRSFKSPHRRNSSKWSQIAKKNSPEKTYRFYRFSKNNCKNEDKHRFWKSPRHEVAFHRSL